MAAIKPSWDKAPEDATHQHIHTGMFYKQVDDRMFVLGGNNKWNISKVVVDASTLEPRPVKEPEEMGQVKVIAVEATTKEEFVAKLRMQGIPEEVIADFVQQITDAGEFDDAGQSHASPACDPTKRTELGMIVGKKLAHVLGQVKDQLELDFDVQDIMNQMGFVKTNARTAEEREEEVAMNARVDALAEVVKEVAEKTGAPIKVVAGPAAVLFAALQEKGLLK